MGSDYKNELVECTKHFRKMWKADDIPISNISDISEFFYLTNTVS